jgi:hypothetical protein
MPDLRETDLRQLAAAVAEPWPQTDKVDELIDLQQQAFRADRVGNYGQFGVLVMQMSKIEGSIGNHTEAAAYAGEAAEAFEQGGLAREALGARSALAREHRITYAPNLALASLQDVLRLRTELSGEETGSTTSIIDGELKPVLRFVNSFTLTYLNSTADDNEYPAYFLPKSPRPTREATEGLMGNLDELLDMPVSMNGEETAMTLLYIHMLYQQLAERQLGLSKPARKTAKSQATRLALDHTAPVKAFEDGDLTINEILQAL